MALETLPNIFGKGGAHVDFKTLRPILEELQGLKINLVDGDSADTNIAISGIATDDTIVFVLGIDADNATPADQVQDFTSTVSITSAGNIQSTSDTSGFDLVVVWFDKVA